MPRLFPGSMNEGKLRSRNRLEKKKISEGANVKIVSPLLGELVLCFHAAAVQAESQGGWIISWLQSRWLAVFPPLGEWKQIYVMNNVVSLPILGMWFDRLHENGR